MAPKTSLFPRLRPNFQEIEREKIQAEEARLRQIKTMGDLEFTADMQPQFVGQMSQEIKDYIGGDNPEKSKYRKIFTYLDDPIAEYGFDPDRIRFEEPSKNPSTYDIIRNDYPENESNAYYASGDVHTDKGTESDVIKYGVKLGSSKEIIAHEARHRGFQLLRNMQLEGSKEDQEAWVKKYGKDAAWLLNLYFSTRDNREFTSEAINELRDRVDTTFNPPKFDAQGNPAGMGAFSGGNFNEGVRNVFLEDLRKSKKSGTIEATQFKDQDDNPLISLDNSQINRAFRGLDQAAKDAMKKQKDDYRKKMTVRSQEGKRKYANGGSVEDQTGQAFKGMGYGEIIADNLIGLDNEYESLGEKIGKQFNQDEAAFLKKMGVGMYEGAKDFISAPIETTKKGFKEFAVGTTDFLFKDLDTRLQEMFKTDYNNATPEQVTKARESVIGDAVIASGILPGGKVIGNIAESIVDAGTNAARKIDLSKVNSAMARANKIAEDVEGKVDQSVLGEGYRFAAKEKMGKGRGQQNSAQTAAALGLGYTEIGFHSTKRYNPNKEIEVFKLPDEIYADRAAAQGVTLKELIDNEGIDFNNTNVAHDFLGVHVGTTKSAAQRFSDNKMTNDMEGARTYQLRLKTNKPFLDGKKPWTEKGLNAFLVKEMNKIKDGEVFEKMKIVRRKLAKQGYTHVPYINNVEDRKNISYAMLVDRPEGGGVNSSAVIRYKDAEFDPLEKFNRNAKYAQGGVAMKDQMEMSFALGGVAETVDPVSGNDVPPGSLPVEVRDDIPARLSEGEYVVPADVVRFFGVKFFEDIRMQAKMGLQQMEEDGRIGGEPVEMASADVDIDSLIDAEMSSMNEGGLMSGYANAGSVVGRRGVGSSYGGRNLSYGTPIVSAKDVIPEIETPEDIAKKLPEVVTPVQAASAGFTGTRTYYDSKGMPVSIQFINGQPQQSLAGLTEKNPLNEGPSLPAGFMSQADFELAVAKGEINPITGLRWSSSKEKETELQGRAKLVNENLNFKDPQKTLDWARDTIATGSEGDSLGFKALGTIGSVLTGGLMGTAINAITVGTNRATVRAAAQIAEDRGYTELSKNLYTIAKGKKKTLATGNSYADDIRKAATQITSGKATPFVGDGSILTGGLTNIKEGLFREDFSPDELGQKKFEESMQDSAPEGYVYVPSATRFIPSSTSLVQTQTGSRIYPTKMVSQTIAGRTVTDPGSYKPKEGYVAGRVGGSPTGKIIRRVARPTKPGEGDGPPPSNVKTSGYVTGAVDRKGNRIQDGTGLAKSDNTYTTSNPKPGSMQDKENKSEDSSNNKSIVCTEMYRQTQLADWSKAMKTWDIYQKKYLTPAHEIGYHWLFRPYVRGMQKNNTLTRLGAYLATERTQHLRHILTKGKAKDSLVGKVWCSIIHPVVYAAGKIKGET